jgi:hypothetical protein
LGPCLRRGDGFGDNNRKAVSAPQAKHKNRIRPAIRPIRVPPPRIHALARAQQDFQRTIDGIDTYQTCIQQFHFSFAQAHE